MSPGGEHEVALTPLLELLSSFLSLTFPLFPLFLVWVSFAATTIRA
jgi:hypothetical protein